MTCPRGVDGGVAAPPARSEPLPSSPPPDGSAGEPADVVGEAKLDPAVAASEKAALPPSSPAAAAAEAAAAATRGEAMVAIAVSAEAIAYATLRCRSSVLSPEARRDPPPPPDPLPTPLPADEDSACACGDMDMPKRSNPKPEPSSPSPLLVTPSIRPAACADRCSIDAERPDCIQSPCSITRARTIQTGAHASRKTGASMSAAPRPASKRHASAAAFAATSDVDSLRSALQQPCGIDSPMPRAVH
eukprot:COSAG06_NODE_18191_length_899_cov_1.252500_2_plen_246_part_00